MMIQPSNSKSLLVLVTGATGLVGSHLVATLLLQGYRVRALRRSTSSLSQFWFILKFYGIQVSKLHQQLQWAEADLFDNDALTQAMQGVDWLFHCAADVNLAAVSEQKMIETNVQGTRQVLTLAALSGIRKVCYMSSIAALGHSKYGEPIDELTPFDVSQPRSVYGKSKIAAEAEVMKADAQGLPAVIVCPGVILGLSNQKESSAQLLFLGKKGIPFIASGGSGYVDVRDVCRAMIQLMQSPIHGERFVVVGHNIRLYKLFQLMAIPFHKKAPWLLSDKVILAAGILSGTLGRLCHREVAFDAQMAKTAIGYSTFSSAKLQSALQFTFTPIEQTVNDFCSVMYREL